MCSRPIEVRVDMDLDEIREALSHMSQYEGDLFVMSMTGLMILEMTRYLAKQAAFSEYLRLRGTW